MRTGIATIVVQFGLATIPFGIDASASGFTSETTSGTSGSMRQAEELSMTTAPAAATRGASQSEVVLPQEKSAISSPVKSALSASSTRTCAPRQGSFDPAERCDAK